MRGSPPWRGEGDDLMRRHRLYRFKPQVRHIILIATCYLLLVSLMGCEAFVRKFTRKPKKTEVREELVLVPEEYSISDISLEERYRQYFLFWKSWQDELIAALGSSISYKKIKGCLKEAIRNLEEMRSLLYEEKQKELDVYLERLRQLSNEISQDIYGTRLVTHKGRAESLKRNILKDFSYSKIKNHLR